jgi:4-amino-4-deoxy-L-arabinose transferase-like glycosyltransferase
MLKFIPCHTNLGITTEGIEYMQRQFYVILLGFMLTAACVGGTWTSLRYFIFTDGTAYATLGKNLAEGRGLQSCGSSTTYYPPGYPLVIALVYGVTGDAELAGHLVSLLAYIGTIAAGIGLAWCIRRSLWFAVLVGGLLLAHPLMLYFSAYVMAESLFAFTVVLSALAAYRLSMLATPPWWLWGVWGALVAFAYLVRADGILYAPLQGLFILLFTHEARRDALKKMSFALVVFAVCVVPYLHFIHEATGTWQLSSKSSIILEYARIKMVGQDMKTESQLTSTLSDEGGFTLDYARDSLLQFLLHEPDEALRRIVFYTKSLVKKPGLTFGLASWLALVFLLAVNRSSWRSRPAALIVLHLLPLSLFLVLYVDNRFLLAFVPFLVLGVARALEVVLRWMWNNRTHRYVGSAAVTLLLLCGGMVLSFSLMNQDRIARTVEKVYSHIVDLPHEHKSMGRWMAANLNIQSTTRISHRNPWVSFYAGGCPSRTPYTGDLAVLTQWAHENRVEYLIVDERMTLPYMPVLSFLLDTRQTYPGLTLVHTIEDPLIVLYRIDSASHTMDISQEDGV